MRLVLSTLALVAKLALAVGQLAAAEPPIAPPVDAPRAIQYAHEVPEHELFIEEPPDEIAVVERQDMARGYIVLVTAEWCIHCPAAEREAEVLLRHGWKRHLRIEQYTDAHAANRDVQALPCYLLFRDGKIVGRHCGALNRWQVKRFYSTGRP